ncbi:MAG: hypothetical protein WB678_15260 [Stellaceae bacterium]
METEKYQELVKRLIDKTNRREIDWKESSFSGVYQVAFSNYSITIGEESSPRQSAPDYVISIINSDGNTMDSFSDVTLDAGRDPERGLNYFEILRDLYGKARRQALGVDKALDEILNELDVPPP